MKRGFFGIGIQNSKNGMNLGTLWRSAQIMGANFIFTIGKRYKRQASDTMKTYRHVPLFEYDDFEHFKKSLPLDCQLIGVELDESSVPISAFKHPERCVYLLGAEDNGLSKDAIQACQKIVQLPGDACMNVAVAGSIVMFDRNQKFSAA